jgi:hypothetical protein
MILFFKSYTTEETMSNYSSFFHRLSGYKRLLALILPVSLAAAGLFAFLSISSSTAQVIPPTYFTECFFPSSNTATILVPGTAPKMHTAGYFMPAAGDEFAVFRPIAGTCATLAPGQCAGAIVWQATPFEAFSVFGDDFLTGDIIEGMLPGERMCWRVWDSSENMVYTATVQYDPGSANLTGDYLPGGFYFLSRLDPTALELLSFDATSSPLWAQKPVLWAGGFLLIGATLVLFRRRRS